MDYCIYQRISIGYIIDYNIPWLEFWSAKCHGVDFTIRVYSAMVFMNVLYFTKRNKIDISIMMIEDSDTFLIKEVGKHWVTV